MPGNVVSFDKMKVGKTGGGKHWTKQEVQARAEAAETVKRTTVKLKPPKWLTDNKTAFDIWKRTLKRLKGISLLDDLDSDTLAVYCKSLACYEEELQKERPDPEEMQRWSRLILSYAEKLGLTPNGRARLAKKQADKIKDPNADLFD